MIRQLYITLVILSFNSSFSQETTLLKVNFWDYCPNISRHAYMAEMTLNDTIVFKKVIDTAYFEFNIPRFLIGKKEITVTATRFSDNETLGTICYPYINVCRSTFKKMVIPRDSIFGKEELYLTLEPKERWSGCGNLPSITFSYNSCALDSASFVFLGQNKSIRLVDTKWDSYCIAEIMRGCDSIVVVGHADIGENDNYALSKCRAETIKSFFCQFGVLPTKIKAQAIGIDKPRFTKEILKKATSKEKLALSKLNARVLLYLW